MVTLQNYNLYLDLAFFANTWYFTGKCYRNRWISVCCTNKKGKNVLL